MIFDSHEDVPKQLLSKPYLGPLSSRILSRLFSIYENYACGKFTGIVAATPAIRSKFLQLNCSVVNINNFPMPGEFNNSIPVEPREREVCYVGGIADIRGIREIVKALEAVTSDVRLNLAGRFVEPRVEAEVKATAGWSRVNEMGFLDRAGICQVLRRSLAGLVTLHPTPSYPEALPVKLFEYMAAGTPCIASNFPLWREIVEESNCGLCVDPLDPDAIAAAIDYLIANPTRAREMGENGRRAVLDKYNWAAEERKLLDFYEGILACPQ